MDLVEEQELEIGTRLQWTINGIIIHYSKPMTSLEVYSKGSIKEDQEL